MPVREIWPAEPVARSPRKPVAGYVSLTVLFLGLAVWLTQSHDTGSILFVPAAGSLVGASRAAMPTVPDHMPDWLLAPLTGSFTLTGTLGGVALGNYLTAKQAAAQRAEDRREHLRRTLADVLVDGREVVELASTLLPAFAKMTDDDMFQCVNTDTG